MDEAESGLQTGEFSCGGVVKEAAEGFAAVALARKLRVMEEIEEKLMMKGDENAVRQLVSILLDNAMTVSYTHLDVYKRQERLRRLQENPGKP